MSKPKIDPVRVVFLILEIAFPLAIFIIINQNLVNVTWYYNVNVVTYQCLLGSSSTDGNICNYGYALAAISLWVTLMLSFIVCCSCGEYGNLYWAIAFTLFGTGWWLAGAIVMTKENTEGNAETDIATDWRNSVTGLSWAIFVIFVMDLIFCILSLLYYKRKAAQANEERMALEAAAHQKQRMQVAAPGADPGYPLAPAGYDGGNPPPPGPGGYAPAPGGYKAPAVELGEFKPPATTADVNVL